MLPEREQPISSGQDNQRHGETRLGTRNAEDRTLLEGGEDVLAEEINLLEVHLGRASQSRNKTVYFQPNDIELVQNLAGKDQNEQLGVEENIWCPINIQEEHNQGQTSVVSFIACEWRAIHHKKQCCNATGLL